eukprot:CAMPEP_0116143482 /NCGR_PEP_ID=MMETSP0329-20121206/15477_1 /TAXON_ID=697910 /ORGANISM="Pseudo-nitzschia arenysensis, Strain B593" /LENGTH=188 /DNA_ID=CAMNT_0003638811 /DNA_START=134 /DNA_END=700 /DNA_ORIENTATION=+
MSVLATTSEETKKESPAPQVDDAATKVETEVSSPPATQAGKKRRKLNDGSSSKTDEATGFLGALSNFFSGTWFWPSSIPAKTDTAKINAKAEDKASEEKKPAEPADEKTDGESDKPTTTDDKKESKDSVPVSSSSGDSDDNDEEDKGAKADEKETKPSSPEKKKKKEVRDKSKSPKAAARGSKKRRLS